MTSKYFSVLRTLLGRAPNKTLFSPSVHPYTTGAMARTHTVRISFWTMPRSDAVAFYA
jgi:hypothetical protein